MEIYPAPGYVLILPEANINTTSSSAATTFVVSDTSSDDENVRFGKVVAVGPTLFTEFGVNIEAPVDIKPGDFVIHNPLGYSPFSFGGQTYKLIKFIDICGKATA